MKAIRVQEFGGPTVLQLVDAEALHPEPSQVVVQVRAVGVNPVDTYIRSGTYAVRPTLPYTPGTDAAGVVSAVGEAVTRFCVGDRVYTAGTISGSYAEQAVCWENQLHPLPERVTFAQGAAVNIPYATAHRALFGKAGARPGESVLIHGASGGVGIAAVQLAVALGLTVVGTAGSEAGRLLVRQQGAAHVLDHHAAGYLDEALAFTNGVGFDVVLEMLANVNLGKDLTVLARGGRVVIIGSRGPAEIIPRDVMSRDASIHGMVLFNTPEKELAGIHSALVAGLGNGSLRPVIAREIPLSEASEAHEAVMSPGAHGKIVLIP